MSALHARQNDACLALRIEGTLTIADVSPLRDELLRAVAAPAGPLAAVLLDAGDVGEVDSAGIQLLMATSAWLSGLQIRPQLASASGSIELVAQAIGAADALHCCGFARTPQTGATP